MKHYVYVLMNEYGVVEYVGCTKRLDRRLYEHTKCTPTNIGMGKFHGRTDLILEIVKEFDTRNEAEAYEGELKLQLGFEWTEQTYVIKGARKTKELYGQPVLAYIKATGKFVGEYESQNGAARQLGVNVSRINRVLSGKFKQAGGYTFKRKTK
jgi:predicted GIY-YIG superfamily endonuclease